MSGRLIGIVLIACGVLAGAAMYYLQVFGYYERLEPGAVDIRITRGGQAGSLEATDLSAIDATSSPIRFRACFTAPPSAQAGAETYPEAVPLNAPFWFSCFDAQEIGDDLAEGRARAFLGQRDVVWGVDRILALYPDGRGFAWHQINPCGKEAFDGNPPPQGCPPLPEGQGQ